MVNNRARIYIVHYPSRDEYTAFGCSFRTRRPVVLQNWFDCGCSRGDQYAPQLWLVAETAAYVMFGCEAGESSNCFARVASVDLRRRRAIRRTTASGVDAGGADLVLKPDGSMAFVLGDEVRAIDAAGPSVLDPGPGVERGSLALAGSRVYWMRGGQAFSALID